MRMRWSSPPLSPPAHRRHAMAMLALPPQPARGARGAVRSGQGRDPPLPRRLINWWAWQAASERTPAHAPIHLVTISPPRHSLQQPRRLIRLAASPPRHHERLQEAVPGRRQVPPRRLPALFPRLPPRRRYLLPPVSKCDLNLLRLPVPVPTGSPNFRSESKFHLSLY